MIPSALTLVDELALAAVRDTPGRLRVDGTTLSAGLAGAIVAELWLAGRVTVTDKRLVVVNPTPLGVALFDQALNRMAGRPKPRRPEAWLQRLSSAQARREVFDRLASLNRISVDTSKLLGIFTTTSYGLLDRLAVERSRSIVQLALAGGLCEPRTATLISLLEATRLLRKFLPGADRAAVRAIDREQWVGKAVRTVIATSQAG